MTEHFMDRSAVDGRKYPFPDMEVGDFFILPSVYAALVRMSATNFGRANSKVFSVLKSTDGYHHCTRVS